MSVTSVNNCHFTVGHCIQFPDAVNNSIQKCKVIQKTITPTSHIHRKDHHILILNNHLPIHIITIHTGIDPKTS